MNRLKVAAAAIGALLSSPLLASATTAPGYITDVFPFTDGVVLFNVVTTRGALPSCTGASLVPNRWAINSKTVAGQSMVAILLTAYSQHKRVTVSGINSCPDWSDTESVWYLILEN